MGSGWGGQNVDFWVTRDEEDGFDSEARGKFNKSSSCS